MFGFFRYALALLVVQGHLWPSIGVWTGTYAVHSFYLLSGYLMALVLDRTYPPTAPGIRDFLLNRGLRIYPPYLAVVLLTIGAMSIDERVFTVLNDHTFGWPTTLDGWLRNFGIFGLNIHLVSKELAFAPRFIPPSWSLDTELCFYILMALGLGRERRIALIWLALSIAFVGYGYAVQLTWPQRFLPLAAASLPFSLGAVLHLWRDRLPRLGAGHAIFALVLYALNMRFAGWTASTTSNMFAPFYLSTLAAAYATASLAQLDVSRLPNALKRIDTVLGDLSYPVFLSHWLAAAIAVYFGIGGVAAQGPELLAIGTVIATALAWGIHRAVEKPIASLRDRTRERARSAAP